MVMKLLRLTNAPFCDAEKETLLHFFCTCFKVASFWYNARKWIESKLKRRLVLPPYNMLVLNVIINFTRSSVLWYTACKAFNFSV